MQNLNFKILFLLASLTTLNTSALDAAKVATAPSTQQRSLSTIIKRHWGKIAIGSAIVLVPLAFFFFEKYMDSRSTPAITPFKPMHELFPTISPNEPFGPFVEDDRNHQQIHNNDFPDHLLTGWAKVTFGVERSGKTSFEISYSGCWSWPGCTPICSKITGGRKEIIHSDPQEYLRECHFEQSSRLKPCLGHWKNFLVAQTDKSETSQERVIRFKNIKEEHPSTKKMVDTILVQCLVIQFDPQSKRAVFHVTEKLYAVETADREVFKAARKLAEEQSDKASQAAKDLFAKCFPQAQEKA